MPRYESSFKPIKRKLGELLIEAGAVAFDDVAAALAEQSAGEPSRLGDLLLSTGKITAVALARALAAQYQMPFTDLSSVGPEASSLIPLEFQRAHKVVPFRCDSNGQGARVFVALADPTQVDLVGQLSSQLKSELVVHVASIDDIESVHAALESEVSGGLVIMGEVLEEDGLFLAANPDPAPSSVTEEELFGSLDLGAPPEVAPLSTALADEIGRHDLDPPEAGLTGPAPIARIALTKLAVNTQSAAALRVSVPSKPVLSEELRLPAWIRGSDENASVISLLGPVETKALSPKLQALLAQVESGTLLTGPALAVLLRLLVERSVIGEAELTVALEKL